MEHVSQSLTLSSQIVRAQNLEENRSLKLLVPIEVLLQSRGRGNGRSANPVTPRVLKLEQLKNGQILPILAKYPHF